MIGYNYESNIVVAILNGHSAGVNNLAFAKVAYLNLNFRKNFFTKERKEAF